MRSVLGAISASFSPLRNLNFRRYMSAQAISMIGTWMQATAQAWVVWQLSHSPWDLGLVAMFGSLPSLLLGPWAGAWADRLERRYVLIATQAAAMALAVALALLVQSGAVTLWHVYLLATLLGCVNALDVPAGDAFIGDLSGIGQVHKSFVVYAMVVQTSRMLGPAVAGWLIATLGVSSAFWLNGMSFLVAIVSLLRVQAHQQRHAHSGNPLMEFWEGLRFSGTEPRIQDLLIFTGYITFFGFSNLQVFPAIATDYLRGGPESLGLLTGAFGAGALVSATFVMPLAQRIPRTGLMFGGVVGLSGVWFVVFSFSRSLPFSMAAIFLAAFGQPIVMATSKALV